MIADKDKSKSEAKIQNQCSFRNFSDKLEQNNNFLSENKTQQDNILE